MLGEDGGGAFGGGVEEFDDVFDAFDGAGGGEGFVGEGLVDVEIVDGAVAEEEEIEAGVADGAVEDFGEALAEFDGVSAGAGGSF